MDLSGRWNMVISKVFFNLDKHLSVFLGLQICYTTLHLHLPEVFLHVFNSHIPAMEQSKLVHIEKETNQCSQRKKANKKNLERWGGMEMKYILCPTSCVCVCGGVSVCLLLILHILSPSLHSLQTPIKAILLPPPFF